jgi:hypothetical protein
MNLLPREKFDKVKDRTLEEQRARHPVLLLRFDFNERGTHPNLFATRQCPIFERAGTLRRTEMIFFHETIQQKSKTAPLYNTSACRFRRDWLYFSAPAAIAKEDGVSLNQWIAAAVAPPPESHN